MASTNIMLQKCSGLIDTTDINDWTNKFLKNVWQRSQQGKRPDLLSGPQVDKLTEIYERHFA